MIEENKRVLLGMSGGTDSSVAAMRLLEAGYEVIGVTFRFYELNGSTEYLEDARSLAEHLGIRHITYDAREVFNKQIIEYFVQEYMAGRTPVPCTLCNNYLKWPLLAELADEMGIFYIATGHYVRKVKLEGTYYITSATDSDKDQTFFLWGLKQDILRRMFCPMDYRSFLKNWLDKNDQLFTAHGQKWSEIVRRGRFVDETGHFIAWHEGYPFYTIGQRRGLGIHLNRPVFVKDIFPEKNEIVLAPLQSLEKTEMWLDNWNLINENRVLGCSDIIVKIRYRKQENHGTVTVTPEHLLHIQLHEPLTAIAPGQAAAFYKDDLLLGGGIIVKAR